MTREEITKEAQEQVNYCTPLHPEDFIHGYIAGAEPREKRIAELVKENADLRDNYDQFKAIAEPEIERLRESNSYMFDTIALKSQQIEKLEKENAELKEELKDANEKVVHLSCNQNKDLKRNITKAKELLNEFMRISKASDEDFEHDYSELIGVTEQFLKK